MARAIHKLTPDRVRKKSKRPGLYPDGGGLYLCVTPPSACSWLFRYSQGWKTSKNGKRYPAGREMGLGAYPQIPLATAREMAERWRRVKAEGRDPIEVRDAERASLRLETAKAITFKQCAEMYIEAQRDGWRNAKHAKQWSATLATYAYPIMGDLPVGQVDVTLLHKTLEPIWRAKTETASRVRSRIESVLNWAKTRGYRTGENPAQWKGHLENLFPARSKVRKVKHHAALPYADLPALMVSLNGQETTGALALQFTILTAARTGEVIAAHWDEFDLEAGAWTVPGSRMKAGREHRVPLSKPALAILRLQHKLTGGHGYVFPGLNARRPLSNMAMSKVLERMGRDEITVHGFRSSFRDWAEEMTGFNGSVAEAALGHVVGDKVEAAYRRGDLFEKRRKLMDAWAMFVTTPAKEGGKVIAMREHASAS